ncbi:MAG: DedA family protein [Dactylosporangium sp.]|nr:DedA family protein [Dactylosporangium sp.]NNJ61174.1 DedA family protein [Dactylosporangium sp.]
MHEIQVWLEAQPPELIYFFVSLIIGLESMGIPLPGEITLVTASLMAASGLANPLAVASAASFGAIVGDSLGYAIGRRGGRALLRRLGRRFPRHFGPAHIADAEALFARWGVWAVFFGRFVALLRILAGPLAGALRVPYHRFLVANASGGLVWGFGTTFTLYLAGQAAERWLRGFGWIALAIAVLFGCATTYLLRRRSRRAATADPAAAETAETAETTKTAETAKTTAGRDAGPDDPGGKNDHQQQREPSECSP